MSDTRKLTHDKRITIRVSAEVKRRATDAARGQGMSLSEAVRQFLRELAREHPSDVAVGTGELPEQVKTAQRTFRGAQIITADNIEQRRGAVNDSGTKDNGSG